MNYRNHRKIFIVDGKVGYIGGMNIGDEYLGKHPKLGHWRDTCLELKGPCVGHLQEIFMEDWQLVTAKHISGERYYPNWNELIVEAGAEGTEGSMEGAERGLKGGAEGVEGGADIPDPTGMQGRIQLIRSGPDRESEGLHEVYFTALTSARKRIYLASPYFIPDPAIAMALRTAAASGLDVRILLPEVADANLVHWAGLSYARELARYGVRFYIYKKGFMHSKILLIDDTMVAIGTLNLDMRSFFSNFELAALLFNKEVIDRVLHEFMLDLEDSRAFNLAVYDALPPYERLKQAFARLLSPLL